MVLVLENTLVLESTPPILVSLSEVVSKLSKVVSKLYWKTAKALRTCAGFLGEKLAA